jgi:hypothetical protein
MIVGGGRFSPFQASVVASVLKKGGRLPAGRFKRPLSQPGVQRLQPFKDEVTSLFQNRS